MLITHPLMDCTFSDLYSERGFNSDAGNMFVVGDFRINYCRNIDKSKDIVCEVIYDFTNGKGLEYMEVGLPIAHSCIWDFDGKTVKCFVKTYEQLINS